MKIKVTTWNIWERCHFDLVTDFIRENGADILTLQEVLIDDPLRNVVGFMEDLGYQYAISPSVQFVDNGKTIKLNNAVFSKFPIVEKNIHKLREGGKGTAIEAKIKIKDNTLSVFSTHLKHTHQKPLDLQNLQIDNLIKVLPREKMIIGGDFNAISDSYAIKKMRELFIDNDLNNTPTWSVYPEGCPICLPKSINTRLDYIFTSSDLKVESSSVGQSKGSDHLPVSLIIEI